MEFWGFFLCMMKIKGRKTGGGQGLGWFFAHKQHVSSFIVSFPSSFSLCLATSLSHHLVKQESLWMGGLFRLRGCLRDS